MFFSLYNKKDTYFVVGGIIFIHALALGLCSFWVYRFLYVTYDPGVYILLAFFLGMTILCDISLSRVQGFSRFLFRCKVDKQGFCVHKPFGKVLQMNWTDIQSYGLLCMYSDFSYNLLFFSTHKHEKRVEAVVISSERISFQIDSKKWEEIKEYIPSDMSDNLQTAIHSKCTRMFYR